MLQAAMEFDYVILEGNMITEIQEAMDLCDRIIFLMINQVFVCEPNESGVLFLETHFA